MLGGEPEAGRAGLGRRGGEVGRGAGEGKEGSGKPTQGAAVSGAVGCVTTNRITPTALASRDTFCKKRDL